MNPSKCSGYDHSEVATGSCLQWLSNSEESFPFKEVQMSIYFVSLPAGTKIPQMSQLQKTPLIFL